MFPFCEHYKLLSRAATPSHARRAHISHEDLLQLLRVVRHVQRLANGYVTWQLTHSTGEGVRQHRTLWPYDRPAVVHDYTVTAALAGWHGAFSN